MTSAAMPLLKLMPAESLRALFRKGFSCGRYRYRILAPVVIRKVRASSRSFPSVLSSPSSVLRYRIGNTTNPLIMRESIRFPAQISTRITKLATGTAFMIVTAGARNSRISRKR